MTTDPRPHWLQNLSQRKWIFFFPIIGLLAGNGLYLLLPKKYESIAHLQRHNPSQGFGFAESAAYFATNNFSVGFPAPYTQTRLLKELVAVQNLTEQWKVDEEEAIGLLKSKIKVDQKNNSHKYTVHFIHSDPQEAQTILQTLINLHLARRAREESQRAERQLEALQAEIEDQELKLLQSESREKFKSTQLLLENLIKTQVRAKKKLQTPRVLTSILNPASLPKRPVIPNLSLNLTVGFSIGALFSIFLLKPHPKPTTPDPNERT